MKWLLILGEEYGEACQAILDHSQLEPWSYRYELVQCAAVALAAIEAFDRRYSPNAEIRHGGPET